MGFRHLFYILNKFLQFSTLYEWFQCGHYDLVNTAEDFFIKLSKALKIDEDTINNEIENITLYKKEIEKFKDSYIFVNTNFKRKLPVPQEIKKEMPLTKEAEKIRLKKEKAKNRAMFEQGTI